MHTKEYRKLFRDTAKKHGVELLSGNWTDSPYRGRVIRDSKRVVTFTVNTDSGNFDSFFKDLSLISMLKSGNAPRFTAPREYVDYVFVKDHNGYGNWEKTSKGHNFSYIKMNVKVA